MSFYGRHDGHPRGADALLTAIVEEAIAETIAPPSPAPDRFEPASAQGFLADAAAFLRTRPDAADLLRHLQVIVTGAALTPPDTPQSTPDAAPEPAPEVMPVAVTPPAIQDSAPPAALEIAPTAPDSPSRNN